MAQNFSISRQWIATLLLAVVAWALTFVVDKSCEFVLIHGRQGDQVVDSIARGTQRGILKPGDDSECLPWAQYDNLTLDGRMLTTRIAAALSIVLGAFCCVVVLIWARYPRKLAKNLAIVAGLFCSIFQGLTHLMISSDLCKGTNFTIVEDSTGREILWDSCTNSTPTYRLTFATLVNWACVALLIFCLPEEENNMEQEQEGPPPKFIEGEVCRVNDEDMWISPPPPVAPRDAQAQVAFYD